MNIFVAGGAGFIGSHLCDALLKKGNTVIVADKLIMGKQNIEHLMHNLISNSMRWSWQIRTM